MCACSECVYVCMQWMCVCVHAANVCVCVCVCVHAVNVCVCVHAVNVCVYVCMQWMCVYVCMQWPSVNACSDPQWMHAVTLSECVCMCACSECVMCVYVCMQWPSGSVLCWDGQPGWRNQPQDQAGTLDVHHISLTCTNILTWMHITSGLHLGGGGGGGGGLKCPPPPPPCWSFLPWDLGILYYWHTKTPFCLHPTFAPQSWMQPWTCIHHTHNYI